ncbi:MAG: phosphate/phosphite/phosphonate ABC transporter substrate-binding protein [Gammaproteobacteria bacterium]|nr:phosphate/phosphite/phosphonate ABC transporter substrate-binding protein [Gammaproteobacteria bacterium]
MSFNLTISPDFSPDHISGWYIFNTWLQRKLDLPIHLEMFDDFVSQRSAIAEDKIDIIYANPFDASMLVREKGFVPIARPAGKADEAVIVVNAESSTLHVEDLQPGARIATTDDPHVHMMCMIMLEPADLNKDNLEFIRCGGYVLVAKALFQGNADAGFFLSEAYDDLSDAIKKNLRVVVRSQISVIEHVLLAGPRLAERHADIASALVSMGSDPKGPGVLQSLGFDNWEPVSQEDTEFMIDLMDTLVS